MRRVNWKRGLLRVWIVFSGLWCLFMVLTSSPWEDYQTYRKFSGAAEDIEQLLLGAENGVEVEFANGTLRTFEEVTEIYQEVERRKARLQSKIRGFLTGLFSVPLGLLAIGLVSLWMVRGFSMQRQNDGVEPH